MIREIVQRGDVEVKKISTVENLADPFTKALANKVIVLHREGLRMKDYTHLLCVKWEFVVNGAHKKSFSLYFVHLM